MKIVYFICIGNSSRSQMAEALARFYGKDTLEAFSGGTRPAEKVASKAVQAMTEIGIDISKAKPKKIDFELAKKASLVIVMGCGAEKMCPAWVVSKSENWDLEDTKDQPLAFYRETRDTIKDKVLELVERAKNNAI